MATPDFVLALREKIGHAPLWLSGVTAVVIRGSHSRHEVLLVRRADTGAWTVLVCGSLCAAPRSLLQVVWRFVCFVRSLCVVVWRSLCVSSAVTVCCSLCSLFVVISGLLCVSVFCCCLLARGR